MASTATRPPTRGSFLPRDPRVEEPYRMTPQLALRIAVLGAITLAVFCVLFFRLWALQVLSSAQYLRAAQNNQVRTVRIEAPRGTIADRNGRILVENREATAVQLWPADLPGYRPARTRLLRRLATVLDVPYSRIVQRIRRHGGDPVTPVTVKEDAAEDEIAYLYERKNEFRGVQLADTYVRRYPYQSLAAHTLGHVAEINSDQLKRRKGYHLGDKIGQAGVEAAYDRYLRGQAGSARLRVDSVGRPRSDVTPVREPLHGYALRLTIDIELQQAAERALRYGTELAQRQDCLGCWSSNGGALVALDPRNGEVLALASNPPFQPRLYVGRPDPKALAPLMNRKVAERENYPALNRVTQGLYPPGSTFKPVTALAAMQEHLLAPYSTLPCTSSYVAGADRQVFNNWAPMNAAMTLPTALEWSCDTYFYQVGYAFYRLPPERGQPLQAWARRLGFGRPTGIDIRPEQSGLVPTIPWKRRTFTKERYPGTWEIDRLWKPGDSIQLAIGQKDMLVTPLQMAVFYSLVANGGKIVRPHVAARVEQAGDARSSPVVRRMLNRERPREINVDPAALAAIREGLYRATHGPNGTATAVFGAFPVPIAGKTGTAEKVVDLGSYRALADQSWFCGYGPSDSPRIVVCAVIENGGYGGAAAAPAALRVFEKFFDVDVPDPSFREAD